MKLIHIYSDDNEYAAQNFELANYDKKEAYEKALKSPNNIWHFEDGSCCEAINFAHCFMTEDFIDFVKMTIGDCHMLKWENFYIVEY